MIAPMMRGLVIAFGLASGCGGKTEEAPLQQATPSCEPTIGAAIQRIAGNDRGGLEPALADRNRLTMVSSCESEHWSSEALACISTARLAVDLSSCLEKLTYEQYQRLQRKLAILNPIGDAGVAVTAPVRDAPNDAANAAPHDAAIVRAPIDAPPPIVKPTPKLDCKTTVVDAKDLACRRQFCSTHVDDIRCGIE